MSTAELELVSRAPTYTYGTLRPYEPPPWTDRLKYRPTAYVELAMRPTPIHRWDLPGVPSGFQVYVKREDLTGSTLSGNKIRKVEFLLADAIQKGHDSVITCGSAHSNHCRTVAMAARQLGLQPHILIRWKKKMDPSVVDCGSNLLLDRLAGTKVVIVPPRSYESSVVDGEKVKGLREMMEEYAVKLRAEGSKPYTIPAGGYNATGDFGYIEAFKELMEQGLLENFDDLVTSSSGGGTASALAVANYLTGSRIKVHSISVAFSAQFIRENLEALMKDLGVTEDEQGKPLQPDDLLDIMGGHEGVGYGICTQEELSKIIELSTTTSVLTDPVFGTKGVIGLLAELRNNPCKFAGKRVLFLHTGGVFGLYDGRINELLKKTASTNQVCRYEEKDE